ncbi:hypothetical protein A4A49_18792 [Nicotiana attenuata]|uniref:Uncharacterized protein n=1 Tax=Nicotiana attenuata TaxID=49451 RepID=A0A1J6IAB5_NICAT|nr:hypothetical protein A4A49_18792 [Nicotiana attenuata]
MSSSSPFSFNKTKPSKSSTPMDDLALVKAATWALYQHGTVSTTEVRKNLDLFTSSFNKIGIRSDFLLDLEDRLSKNKKAQELSRYKLQVIKEVQEIQESPNNIFVPIQLISTTCNSTNNISLLDKYEIEKISRELNQYIETSHVAYHEKKNISEKKIKKFKGLLFRYRVIMNKRGSSSHDVVERRAFSNPQSPEKYYSPAPVVKFANCRPWRKHV